MTAVMWGLAAIAISGAIISIVTHVRTRSVARHLDSRAEALYQSALSVERATDRALASLVNPEPEPTTAELELDEVLRRLNREKALHEIEFAPLQLAFSTWDPAQARRAVELARGTGALTDGDVDYLDYTRRLGSGITHEAHGKRKLLSGF